MVFFNRKIALAYSLIPINEATSTELQQLKWIGPKRAERILQYRTEVSNILVPADLVAASGLGPSQAREIYDHIDWSSTEDGERYNATVIFVSVIASAATIVFSISRIEIDFSTTPHNLYNLALALVLLGAGSSLLDLLLVPWRSPLALLSITLTLVGLTMLATLLIFSLTSGLSTDFATRVETTFMFLVFLLLIVYLNNGPSLHLGRLASKTGIVSELDAVAMIYDYGHLFLAALVLSILAFVNSNLWFEEIFSIWASVILIINGFEMVKGVSPYVSNLSSKERATLKFLLHQEDAQHRDSPELLQRVAGWWSIGSGLLILYVVTAFVFL